MDIEVMDAQSFRVRKGTKDGLDFNILEILTTDSTIHLFLEERDYKELLEVLKEASE